MGPGGLGARLAHRARLKPGYALLTVASLAALAVLVGLERAAPPREEAALSAPAPARAK